MANAGSDIHPATQTVTRVGARRPDLVSAEVRVLLEGGEPSVNHMEQMAFDMGRLLIDTFPELKDLAGRVREGGLVSKMRAGGEVLLHAYGQEAWTLAAQHRSDTVRGWGAMAVGACPSMSPGELFAAIEVFADDPHFAVREWAWLSVRPRVIADPLLAIEILSRWTNSHSPRVRRFSSEATRPRGVWSAHIPALKTEPELAEGLLSELRADPSTYVQDSVGNWLNDASKSRPNWVRQICDSWLADDTAKSTQRICRRGLRTLAD